MLEKVTLSIIFSLAIGVTGVLVRVLAVPSCDRELEFSTSGACNEALLHAARYLIAFGLFGFAGGFTNWVALQMLFYRIPLVYGSGVIPSRHKKIRETVKNVVLSAFFDEGFLDKYVGQKIVQMATVHDAGKRLQAVLQSAAVEQLINAKLDGLFSQSEGDVLRMIGICREKLKPMIRPLLLSLAADLAPGIANKLAGSKGTTVVWLKRELDAYMTLRLQELTKYRTTSLLRQIIGRHLGWIVVWGTVFGALVGLLCEAINISPEY